MLRKRPESSALRSGSALSRVSKSRRCHAHAPSVQFRKEERMAVALTKRRFTVDEYHRMAEAGILREAEGGESVVEGKRVELGSRRLLTKKVIYLTEVFVR